MGIKHRIFAIFRGTVLVLGLVSVIYLANPRNGSAQKQEISSNGELAPRTAEENQVIRVYKAVSESVVFISTVTLTYDPYDFYQDIQPREGSGSGVIIDAERGIVLTNLHVIKDAHQIEIFLASGQSAKARLVGYDETYDVAVIQLVNPPGTLTAAPFGDSSKLEVGQRVLAIGNPFGLNRTLTTGIISSLNRAVKSPSGKLMTGLVQTDAAINPGNSGGPLLDAAGRLIGINTAILSTSGDSAGIGFAVPINGIKNVLPELIATGRVLRANLGWVLVDTNFGPMVRRVWEKGPADLAGIQPIERRVDSVFVKGYVRDFDRADLIVAVNGIAVSTRDEVEALITQADPEKPISFTVRRGGVNGPERELKVKAELR